MLWQHRTTFLYSCSASRATTRPIHDDASLARNAATVALERASRLPAHLVICRDWRSAHRGARRTQRIDRLVLLPALRFTIGVRGPAGHDTGGKLSDLPRRAAYL